MTTNNRDKSMETASEQIKEQQRLAWNKFSAIWKKRDEFTMNFMRPIGDVMISALELRETDRVLDIAAGTGEPGLTIAAMVKHGWVTGTDLSEDMLAIARENAEMKGLPNYSPVVADVCALPFEDNTFDAVTCRMGFMFFPDMQQAANEIARVLKPGGRVAASVWAGPEANVWVTLAMSTIKKHVTLPQPEPGAPGLFRCARQGMVAELFRQAGLGNVSEQNISGSISYGSKEYYWDLLSEMSQVVVNALAAVPDAERAAIRDAVYEAVDASYPDTRLPLGAIVVSGVKAK